MEGEDGLDLFFRRTRRKRDKRVKGGEGEEKMEMSPSGEPRSRSESANSSFIEPSCDDFILFFDIFSTLSWK